MNELFHEFPVFALLAFAMTVIAGAALLLSNVIFAIGVMRDGDRIRERGADTQFVGPAMWALGVLVGSFAVVALYWVVHHSTLRAPVVQRS